MSHILFIVRSGPYTPEYSSDEAHDLIMASTAYGHSASALFVDDGVNQLLASQSPPDSFKNTAKRIKAFGLFDVEPVYVCEQSLQARKIAHDLLIDKITTVDEQTKSQLLVAADFTIEL